MAPSESETVSAVCSDLGRARRSVPGVMLAKPGPVPIRRVAQFEHVEKPKPASRTVRNGRRPFHAIAVQIAAILTHLSHAGISLGGRGAAGS